MHTVTTLCPICTETSVMGMTDMTGQNDKHICPLCGGRHYGEPEGDSMGGYVCGRCEKASPVASWKVIKLSKGEAIQGPIQACNKCLKSLGEDKVAFIEIKNNVQKGRGDENRTGNIWFFVPPDNLKEAIKDRRSLFIERSMVTKLKKQVGFYDKEKDT